MSALRTQTIMKKISIEHSVLRNVADRLSRNSLEIDSSNLDKIMLGYLSLTHVCVGVVSPTFRGELRIR